MTIKVGNEDDHALLMASLMRTCKHETLSDFNTWKDVQRLQTTLRKDKDQKFLTINGDGAT